MRDEMRALEQGLPVIPDKQTVGDFLDKPLNAGGLALSRYTASAVLLVFITACILMFKQRPANSAAH